MKNDSFKLKILRNTTLYSLLLLVFLIPFLSMQNFSPVVDEITHLPSGYSYLKTGEIKLNPQHPPLIKMLAALPLLFLDLKFNPADPNLAGPEINDPLGKTQGHPEQGRMDEWQFGRDFLFSNGVDRVIFWGRIPMILLSVLLGWYVYKWGKELFGYGAGIIGLFIYALMPNIIAHSQLVTTDLGLSTFSFIALYYLWKLLKSDFNRKYLVYSGIFLGLALGSKFSAVFLLPIFFLLLAVYVYKKHGNLSWLSKTNLFLKISLPIYGLAVLTVWGLYFFTSDLLFYWKGLNMVYADSNVGNYYYLNGNFNQVGWWHYFLWAFIIKTPIPFLVILAGSLIYYKKQGLSFLDSLFIFLPVVLFLFMASWKAHNIGVRYILPIYPFLILFVSGWLATTVESLKLKVKSYSLEFKIFNPTLSFSALHFLLLTLLFWYACSSISVYPDYLAYFNEIVGGPKNGYKYLDDSNIDWGHDLKRLAEFQNKNPDLKVAYVWDEYVDSSKLFGIKNLVSLSSADLWFNPKGKYAVSTHAVIKTRLLSHLNKDNKLNWMDNYKPIGRIGQSFFIYEFP